MAYSVKKSVKTCLSAFAAAAVLFSCCSCSLPGKAPGDAGLNQGQSRYNGTDRIDTQIGVVGNSSQTKNPASYDSASDSQSSQFSQLSQFGETAEDSEITSFVSAVNADWMKVIYQNAFFEEDKIKAVKDLVSRNVTAIAVKAGKTDSQLAKRWKEVLESARNSGIPVIFFNCDPPTDDSALYAAQIQTKAYVEKINGQAASDHENITVPQAIRTIIDDVPHEKIIRVNI